MSLPPPVKNRVHITLTRNLWFLIRMTLWRSYTSIFSHVFRIGSKTRVEIPFDDMTLKGLSVRMCNETKRIIIEGSSDAIPTRAPMPIHHKAPAKETYELVVPKLCWVSDRCGYFFWLCWTKWRRYTGNNMRAWCADLMASAVLAGCESNS